MSFITIVTLVNLLMLVLAPMYLSYRAKMSEKFVHKNLKHEEYTLVKIWKFLLLNFAIMVLGLIAQLWFFTTHVKVVDFRSPAILGFMLFLIVYIYGNGIYTAAVINESYTLKPLRKVKEFKILQGAELVMHGPVSHVMMFASILASLGMIAALETQQTALEPLPGEMIVLLAANGIVSGLVYGLSQIFNLTWRDQLPPLLIITNLFVAYLLSARIPLAYFEFSIYYFFLLVSASLVLIGYFLQQNLHKQSYIYQNLLPRN